MLYHKEREEYGGQNNVDGQPVLENRKPGCVR